MKKVLVIDDHKETVELIRSLIMAGRDDSVVLAASSAEVALRVMRQTSFDLLIVDERLPGMRGYEFVDRVKRALPGLPVIMVTGYSVREVRRKARKLGVDYFLAKPFSAPDLLEKVEICLSGASGALDVRRRERREGKAEDKERAERMERPRDAATMTTDEEGAETSALEVDEEEFEAVFERELEAQEVVDEGAEAETAEKEEISQIVEPAEAAEPEKKPEIVEPAEGPAPDEKSEIVETVEVAAPEKKPEIVEPAEGPAPEEKPEFLEPVEVPAPDKKPEIVEPAEVPALEEKPEIIEPVGVPAPEKKPEILEPVEVAEPEEKPEIVEEPGLAASERLQERLAALRTDTDAHLVLLASADGQVEAWQGDAEGLQLDKLARVVAASAEGGLKVSESLDSDEPFSVQYQVGRQFDLFSANIGRRHCLAVILSARGGRGRIGPVWLYTQRAIPELQGIIYGPPAPTSPEAAAEEPGEPQQESDPVIATEEDEADLTTVKTLPADAESEGVEGRSTSSAQIEPAAEESPREPVLDRLLDELVKTQEDELNLDTYWDEALTADLRPDRADQAISFDEARRQGLVPPELFEEEDDPPENSVEED